MFDCKPTPKRLSSRYLGLLLGTLFCLVLTTVPATAQPFGAWMNTGATSDYIQIPHNPALNPTSEFTFEAWVLINGTSCQSLAGKGWTSTWWVGSCSNTLRSYLRGSSSVRDGGRIPNNQWTHVAVTFDGTTRKHFINGEQRGSWNEPGPLTTNSEPMRIGSDVDWTIVPDGALDEIRLWNRARTKGQLREWINQKIDSPQPGLVGVWGLDGGGITSVGPHDGNIVGTPGFLTFPVAINCGANTPTSLCLSDRFVISGEWRKPDETVGPMMTAPAGTPDSGLFWFFNANNWEILVKTLNGCGFPNPHYWVFSASTTNVFYRMEVFDIKAGVQKIYFNYPGPPAPAVTDTTAFATCP